jgi:hypothetical protein
MPTILNRTTETIEVDNNKNHKVLRPDAVPEDVELRNVAPKYDPRQADDKSGLQPEHATVAVFTARGKEESSPSTIDDDEVVAKRKMKVERFGPDAAVKGDVEETSQIIDADKLSAKSPTKGSVQADRLEAKDRHTKDVFKHGDDNGEFDVSKGSRVLEKATVASADGVHEATVDKDVAKTKQTFEDFNGNGTEVESGAKRAVKKTTVRDGDDSVTKTKLDQSQKSSVKSMDGTKKGPSL